MLRLSYPDVVMEPSSADIKKALARLASCIVEATKLFVRWMDGTCLEAHPIPGLHGSCKLSTTCPSELTTGPHGYGCSPILYFCIVCWAKTREAE